MEKEHTDISQEELKKVRDGIVRAFAEDGVRRWALMLFFTELEMGISNSPNKWVNTGNAYFTNGVDALNAYANTKCPASQLVDGETPEELEQAMLDMIEHYKDDKWLEENLYPYM